MSCWLLLASFSLSSGNEVDGFQWSLELSLMGNTRLCLFLGYPFLLLVLRDSTRKAGIHFGAPLLFCWFSGTPKGAPAILSGPVRPRAVGSRWAPGTERSRTASPWRRAPVAEPSERSGWFSLHHGQATRGSVFFGARGSSFLGAQGNNY